MNGSKLDVLIQNAEFSICPSECYENCPFSVMESQALGVPVLGAYIGGIPELIEEGVTGELFESGNVGSLTGILQRMYYSKNLQEYKNNCILAVRDSISQYVEKMLRYYK